MGGGLGAIGVAEGELGYLLFGNGETRSTSVDDADVRDKVNDEAKSAEVTGNANDGAPTGAKCALQLPAVCCSLRDSINATFYPLSFGVQSLLLYHPPTVQTPTQESMPSWHNSCGCTWESMRGRTLDR